MHELEDAIQKLSRGDAITISSYFHEVTTQVQIHDTAARCHIHCINLDGNGQVKIDSLISYLITMLIDYTIPKSKIIEAKYYLEQTGSTQKFAKLGEQAKSLFTQLAKTGEGGELILFLLAERFLGLPQLICKMNLKTSTEMHYHGADGLHVGVNQNTGLLNLYWGESKLYSDLTQGIYDCMKSLAPMILGTSGFNSPDRRDLQLLDSYLDLDDPVLESALKQYLDPDDPKFNQVSYSGICLIGFDCSNYPTSPNSQNIEQVKQAMLANVQAWSDKLKNRLIQEKIETFNIHALLLPFPSVDNFRLSFLKALNPNHGT